MVDIEAIKRKLAQINGDKVPSEWAKTWWRPKKIGEYKVRIVPWQDNKGQPFKEIWYYKNIGVKDARGNGPFPMPTRAQFKLNDPIQELIDALRAEDNGPEKNKDILKSLYPKMTVIVPVLVRGEEDMGVRLWAINDLKGVYQTLLSYFVKEEVLEETDDWTSVDKGYDLTVTVYQSERKWQGKFVNDVKVELGRKLCPLSKDADQIEKWKRSIPDLAKVEPVLEYDEMKNRLNAWASSSKEANDSAESTERGSSDDKLDELSRDLGVTDKRAEKTADSKPEKTEAHEEKPADKKVEKSEKKQPSGGKKTAVVEKDIDDMFKDLEDGN